MTKVGNTRFFHLNTDDLHKLHRLVQRYPVLLAIGLCFSLARKNDRHQHTVQRLVEILAGEGWEHSEKEIRDALKALTEVFPQMGKLILGRRGHPTRMTWEVNIPALGLSLAKAEEDQNLNTLN